MPIQAIGDYMMPLPLVYLFLACSIPAVIYGAWKSRKQPSSFLIPAAVLLLAFAVTISELSGNFSIRAILRFYSYFLIVAGVAFLSKLESRRSLLVLTLYAGAVLCTVSLLGYGIFVMTCSAGHEIIPFSYTSSHPVFAGIPRLAGTMGVHPQD